MPSAHPFIMRNYTRLSFWRDGQVTQIVEFDLSVLSPQQARRRLRVWFARMASLEPNPDYSVRVSVGSIVSEEGF